METKPSSANTSPSINERPVDDISIHFFYKTHTVLAILAISTFAVVYCAFVRSESNGEENIWTGILSVICFFLIISVLAFPNGSLYNPPPVVSRILLGVSVLYMLFLQFLLFQNHQFIMNIVYWFDPKLRDFYIDMDKDYGANCSDISVERVWSYMDEFVVAHLLTWTFKAFLIRHMGILWTISIMWEITELTFAHLLPNFVECWWDAVILDIVLCNGLGIWCGLKICKLLGLKESKWASISDISTSNGKFNGGAPDGFTHVRWLHPKLTYMRILTVFQLIIFWQITDLMTFIFKHVFVMPIYHPIVQLRIVLLSFFLVPSLRQYSMYITDKRCKRLDTQCWVFGTIMVTEAMLCIKNGKELFVRMHTVNVIIWLLIQLGVSIIFVYGCMVWQKYFANDSEPRDTSPLKDYNHFEQNDSVIVRGDSQGTSPKKSPAKLRVKARKD